MLEIQDILTAPEGMNQQSKPWQIPDSQCRFLQDGLLHKESLIQRRGPVKVAVNSSAASFASISDYAVGIVATEDPAYRWRIAVLHGSGSTAKLGVLSTDYTSLTDSNWGQGVGIVFSSSYRYKYQQSAHPWGGTILGTQHPGAVRTQTTIGHWAGATQPESSAGTATVSAGSTAVTGSGTSWLTTAEPGTFFYARVDVHTTGPVSGTFLGIVLSVQSDTALTLVEPSPLAVTGRPYRLLAARALSRRVAKGTITCTTSAARVEGQNTKFKRQGLANPATNSCWAVFRSDDMQYVGKVTSVQTDNQLTLTSNAAIACNKDKYVAIDLYDQRDLMISSAQEQGWLTAHFAGRQWYGNRPFSNKGQPYSPSRIWFSDIFDPEALDLTADGDHILIPSSSPPIKPITGMYATPSCLVVTKEDETYGVFGTDETNFTVRKICEDGAFTPMTFQPWGEGVIWAGQKGIWFFDGSEAFNIIEDRIGDWYERAVEQFPSNTYQAWSMLHMNNYFLYIDKAAPEFVNPDNTQANDSNVEPAVSNSPIPYLGLCVQLERRAVSTVTNMAIVGSVKAPFEEVLGTLYLVNNRNQTTPFAYNGARICNAKDLFESDGLDTILTGLVTPSSTSMGPDLLFESKRFDLNDPQLKKRWKQLQGNFWIKSMTGEYVSLGYTGAGVTDYDNNYLNFSTIIGMNEIVTPSLGKWRITRVRNTSNTWVSGFQNKKLKFNKRSQHIAFKIGQSNRTGLKDVKLGAMALAFKRMRPGRV